MKIATGRNGRAHARLACDTNELITPHALFTRRICVYFI